MLGLHLDADICRHLHLVLLVHHQSHHPGLYHHRGRGLGLTLLRLPPGGGEAETTRGETILYQPQETGNHMESRTAIIVHRV